METNSSILLYDDYCPLCTWYSAMFVRFGLLKSQNRVSFSKADLTVLTAIDIERGKDEIPLFDPATGKTLYGLDALLEILGQRIPLVKSIGNVKMIKWLLQKAYRLVSYNRKVIVATKCGSGQFDCSPGFHVTYRLLFMFIFFVFNSIMLLPLHSYLLSPLSFYHLSFAQLEVAHMGFAMGNCAVAITLDRKQALEYLGQVNMLAIICILLLTPIAFLTFLAKPGELLTALYFFFLTVFIIREYFRRMRYANILGNHDNIVALNLVCLGGFLFYVFH